MTKHWFSICIGLTALALLAGCEGPASAPTPPRPPVIQPVRPTQQPPVAEPNKPSAAIPQSALRNPQSTGGSVKVEGPGDGGRANHRQAAIDDATRRESRVPEPNETEKVEAGKQEIVEPNKPPAAIPQSEIRNPQPTASFLKSYTELLESYVHEDGAVDYADLRRRRLELKPILMELGELDPNSYAGWSNDEKLAFWINVYNLKMLEIITRNYPIQSSRWLRLTWPPSDIRHIAGIRTDYKLIVMGEEFTLAEVEQRFLHRTFSEPRAYLAITYACRSGPPLRRKPYDGEHLVQQLDEQVKAFLASPQGLRIDRRTMTVSLSAIFKPAWRGKEFVAHYGTDKKFKERDPETRAVLNFLAGHLSRDDAYFLETENYTLEYMNFDWRLNDASGAY